MVEKKYYCLFEGRHEIPSNKGAVFKEFNFEDFTPIFSEIGQDLFSNLGSGNICYIYVTGLTPALCFLIETIIQLKKEQGGNGKLICLHFDKNSLSYRECGAF